MIGAIEQRGAQQTVRQHAFGAEFALADASSDGLRRAGRNPGDRGGFEVAIETNGTLAAPKGIDWICVSPKANAEFVQQRGDELKLIFPQPGAAPERYANAEFANFFLQPMDSPQREANTRAAIEYCMRHPQWRLSLQTHKLLGLR